MAGIYRNQTEGIISLSSDGTTRITIADKNLGATQVYNDGDTLSEANAGKYYQWGNNYGFPYTGATSIQGAQINASTYGPNNYYSNFVWVNYTGSWDSSDNQDLRGDTTNTLVARRGPCDDGYHIMSESEMMAFISSYKAITGDNNFANAGANLMLPLSYRTIANVLDTTEGDYWCSTPYNSYGRCLTFTGAYSVGNNIRYKSYGHHIRPFKNEAVQPDRTWTKLYGDDILPPFLKWFIKNGNYYYFGDAPIHISGLALDKSSISLTTVGQTEQLTATITPSDAVEKTVTWSSSDTSIATVSQNGLVTCVTPGECTITATCGEYSASCNVIRKVNANIEFLLVAGGGAGGGGYCMRGGGGGGAGGLIYCSSYPLNVGVSRAVVIGAGGTGNTAQGCNGGDSCFGTIKACGGGGGGMGGTSAGSSGTGAAVGRTGGSGGGYGAACRCQACGHPGGCVAGQGNCGGTFGNIGGGGGGGYSTAGCASYTQTGTPQYNYGGNGGDGLCSNISGAYRWYAGGGGGGMFYCPSQGYCCGAAGQGCHGGANGAYGSGGRGAYSYCFGGGGGGGVGAINSVYGYGGDGYQGVFIARYPTVCGYHITGGTCYTCGDYTIHCFTSDGTLTVN